MLSMLVELDQVQGFAISCQGPVRASLMTLPALSQLVVATADATFGSRACLQQKRGNNL